MFFNTICEVFDNELEKKSIIKNRLQRSNKNHYRPKFLFFKERVKAYL